MADFRINVIVDPTRARRGTRAVQSELTRVGQQADRTRGQLARAFAMFGAGAGGFGAIRVLANFEQEMSTVKAVANATEGQFRSLREEAERLGAKTRFSASQAASGMVFLARAGFQANDILEATVQTLTLAQAGALDLASAADIASNVLQGFNIKASESQRVVDVLALAANSANTNVEQLGQAMSFVAPASESLGVSLEQTAAAVGALSDAGIQATRAGTGLRQIFIQLQDAGAEYDIQTRGLIPVLQTLQDQQIGIAEATDLVGARQAASLLVMVRSIDKIQALTNKLKGANGAAKRIADTMDDNLNGALLKVKSAVEALILSLGASGGTNGLRGLFERIASLIRLMAANADILGVALTGLAAIITGKLVFGALMLLKKTLLDLSKTLLGLSARTMPLLVGVMVAGFALIAAKAKADGKTIKEVVDDIKDAAGDLYQSFIEPTEAVNGFTDAIGQLNREYSKSMEGLTRRSDMGAKRLSNLIDKFQSLRDTINKRMLFQEVFAPGTEGVKIMREQVETLDRALKALRKSLDEVKTGGANLPTTPDTTGSKGPKKPVVTQDFKDYLRDLAREGELLRLNNQEREIREGLFQAEDALGRKLSATEARGVELLIKRNQGLRDQREMLDEIKGPAADYERRLEALNSLLRQGKINTQEFTDKTEELRLQFLETQTDMASGFERGILKIKRDITDLASASERLLTNAFSSAEDAFVDFVKTGKLDFSSLVDSMISDLARLALRSAMSGLFGGGGGGGGGIFGGLFGGGGGGMSFGNIFNDTFGITNAGYGGVTDAAFVSMGFNDGGSFNVGGKSGIDQNVMSINGRPIARVSQGEAVNITPNRAKNDGNNVKFEIIDQRGTDAPALEVQERQGPGGEQQLRMIIKETTEKMAQGGGLDKAMRNRYNLTPTTRGR